MPEPRSCPETQQLSELLAGGLSVAAQTELTQHIEGCVHCQQTLDTILPASSSWEATLARLRQPEPPLEAALEQYLHRAQNEAAETQAEPRADPEEHYPYLLPASVPGQLGRLGHYEILELLGKGGFGSVFRAFDEKLHRMVAIKVLAPELAANGTARKRFIREAQAAAAVKNDHIVAIYNVADEQVPPYLVMELIDGITLQGRLDKEGSLELKEILRIGMQMAEGLAAAHKQGLIHRDIKPGNILLENGVQRVKITDFGLAKVADDASVTQSGVIAGTPMYMSPEQADGQPLDHRSDLFSLGTVLYAMCTGRPPFRASGTMGVLKRVCEETPRPIREINPEIPAWLEAIISKLHAKKPEERYQSARQVADLLGSQLAELQLRGTVGAPVDQDRGTDVLPVESTEQARRLHHEKPPHLRRWLVGVGMLTVILALAWWLHPHLLLFLRNDGHLWINGKNATNVEWVLSRDDEVVKEFKGLGFQGFNVPPGDYLLRPKDLQPGARFQFETKISGLFSGGAGRKEADHLTFRVERGQYVRIEARLLPPKVVEPIAKQTDSPEAGWVQLFNGKDLTGWDSATRDWRVENRVLVSSGQGVLTALWTKRRDFSNFHLRGQAKLVNAPKSVDAAITIRMNPNTFGGYRAQLGTGAPETGSWQFRVGATNPQLLTRDGAVAIPRDTWFDFEIIADGPHLTFLVNGQQATRTTDDRFRQGAICLEQMYQIVHFKKIEIKELPPTPSAPLLAIAPFNTARARVHQKAWAAHLGKPVEFENLLKMKMRLIPPGEFLMGLGQAEVARLLLATPGYAKAPLQSEAPPRPVKIEQPFYLGVHEVTVGQFRNFVKATNYRTTAEINGKGGQFYNHEAKKMDWDPKLIWSHPKLTISDDHPVVMVSSLDARAFCEWLSQQTHEHYFVPNEMQWEYACRAGTAGTMYWGADPKKADQYEWNAPNAQNQQSKRVGTRLPNPFGLFDMLGNATEIARSADGKSWVQRGHDTAHAQAPRASVRFPTPPDNIWFRTGFRVAMAIDTRTAAAPPVLAGFGQWLDPKGDCKHELKDGVLTITIPPGEHRLDPKKPANFGGLAMNSGNQDAPRVLQEVAGDFTLEVAVREMKLKDKVEAEKSFIGAGLLLWQDQDNFLKLLRRPDGALFIAFARGGYVGGLNRSGNSPIALRIERKGKTCVVQLSNDGKEWQTLSDANTGRPFSKWSLPAKLHVGIVAESNLVFQAADFTFETFRLVRPR